MAAPRQKRLKQIKQPAASDVPAAPPVEKTMEIDGITVTSGDLIRIDGLRGRFQFVHVTPAETPAAAIVRVNEMAGSAIRIARFFYASRVIPIKPAKKRTSKAAV